MPRSFSTTPPPRALPGIDGDMRRSNRAKLNSPLGRGFSRGAGDAFELRTRFLPNGPTASAFRSFCFARTIRRWRSALDTSIRHIAAGFRDENAGAQPDDRIHDACG